MQLDIVRPVIRGNLLEQGWRRRRIRRDHESRVASSQAVLMIRTYVLETL
ncbi:hypothetical protein [Sphingopyxis fribergensis]|nr:hypothetical protein [Sphingopyxis fribergensis]